MLSHADAYKKSVPVHPFRPSWLSAALRKLWVKIGDGTSGILVMVVTNGAAKGGWVLTTSLA